MSITTSPASSPRRTRRTRANADLVVFPELCVSSYAIDDLHLQNAMLDAAERALATIAQASAQLNPVLVVGAPLRRNAKIYNCAIVIARGRDFGRHPQKLSAQLPRIL